MLYSSDTKSKFGIGQEPAPETFEELLEQIEKIRNRIDNIFSEDLSIEERGQLYHALIDEWAHLDLMRSPLWEKQQRERGKP